MRLIKNKEELIANLNTIECLITEGTEDEQAITYDLIRLGSCFVAYQIGKELRFAPSRFLGYANNNLNKHSKAKKKRLLDGKDTNPVISQMLGKLSPNIELDKHYVKYCIGIGLTASEKRRKYWACELDEDFIDNTQLSGDFPEGKIVERIHKARERNLEVVQIAKDNFKKKHGRIFCQICDFDFEKTYGRLGIDFIEGHHTIAVRDMIPGHKTKPEDIAMLCANCHRMVHKRRPWLAINDLSKLIAR